MNHLEARELCGLEAAGALEAAETARLDQHLGGCAECRRYQLGLHEVMAELPYALTPVAPSPLLRDRLLARVQADARAASPPVAPPARLRRPAWWVPWAALAAAAGVGYVLFVEVRQLGRELELALQMLDRQNRVIADLRGQLAPVHAASSKAVNLKGLEATPAAFGKAIIDPRSGQGLFYAYKLPPPPPGKTYQLWALEGGKPYDAGIFVTDAQGNGYLLVKKLPRLNQIDAVAVTVEPAGGVPAPTGAMVLLGT